MYNLELELLSDVGGYLILSSDKLSGFHAITISLFLSVLKYLKTGWNTNWFCDLFSSEKYFVLLRILYPSIKSLVNPFGDIRLTSSDRSFTSFVLEVIRSFNFFSASTCLALFEVTFLLIYVSFSSKSVIFTESAISCFPAKFSFFNLSVKFSFVNLLHSVVVIYLIYLLWSGIVF